MTRLTTALGSLLLLSGCLPPTTPVTVALRVPRFRVQTVRSGYTAADITTVKLSVYRGGAKVTEKTVAAGALLAPVTLSNLRMATTYRIQADAYQNQTLISDASASGATFTTPGRVRSAGGDTLDVTPLDLTVPIALAAKPYDGQASFKLNLVSTFNGRANSIETVRFRLVRVADATETDVASRTFALSEVDAGQLESIGSLRLATTYTLYADGLRDDGKVVSDPTRSNVSFTTPAVTPNAQGVYQVEDTVGTLVVPLSR